MRMHQNTHYVDQPGLEDHKRIFHKTNPFGDYLQEIVYGGSDGIVTTLAVISGFVGAQMGDTSLATSVVVLFGLANLLGDGWSMGLGSFLSVRSEKAVWRRQRSLQQIQIDSDFEKSLESTKYLLVRKGYSKADATILAQTLSKNKDHWVQFMLEEEIGVANAVKENPLISSVFTFFAFLMFGFLPLIPYLFALSNNAANQYLIAVAFAILSLTLLGLLRRSVTHESPVRAIGETLLVGGFSSFVAYLVGTLVG